MWRKDTNLTFLIIGISLISLSHASEPQHRTKAATEKQHDLWCYRCDTMIDGERCLDLVGNYSSMYTKCSKEQKKCQVRRISMSTSTDEITGKPKMWLLQRNCSETCEPGCIVIGERTKLHSCITCCDEHNFCNAGSGSESVKPKTSKYLQSFRFIFLVCEILVGHVFMDIVARHLLLFS